MAAGLRGQFFHHRSVFYGLVAVVIGLAAGADLVLRGLLGWSRAAARVGVPVGLGLALAAFQALVLPRTLELRERPHAPLRDVVTWIARDGGPDALRLGYGKSGDMAAIYDPWLAFATSAGPVEALARRAREERVPFYVAYGHPGENRHCFACAHASRARRGP